jgi:hypothetical protein
VEEVGKTTFLNAVLNKTEPKRRTAKPYAVVVQLPDTDPAKFAAVIDSVGERFENQFAVAMEAELICVFLDHNSSSTRRDYKRQRINDERRLIEQIAETKQARREGANKAIVVQNKFDLWKDRPASVAAMRQLGTFAVNTLRPILLPGGVRDIYNFTNKSSGDITRLLTEIKNAIES